MAAPFSITVQAQRVEARIKQMLAAGADMRPVWQTIGNVLVNRIRLCFRLSRDPWGLAWSPIKWRAPRVAVTTKKLHGPVQPGQGGLAIIRRRRNKDGNLVLTKYGKMQLAANVAGKAGQPLVDTGRLRRSVVARASANEVVVGTNVAYARTHQFGAKIRPKRHPFLVFPGPSGELIFSKGVTVPARPFMPINVAHKLDLPPTWASNIIRTLVAHFKLGPTPVSA
jgi:phage gpG-like protein